MAHLKKSGTTGHLLKNASGHLVVGCASCPADCTACGNRTAVISGLTGDCSCGNGTYTLTKSGCVWQYSGDTSTDGPFSPIVITLECVAGNWTVTVVALSICASTSPVYNGNFQGQDSKPHRSGTDDCGRTGTYTLADTSATTCSGQTATVVIS